MRVLILVFELVYKNCDIIVLVLDIDMNYDLNILYNKCYYNNIKINFYDIIKNCGIIYMGYMKVIFSLYYKDNIYNKGKI